MSNAIIIAWIALSISLLSLIVNFYRIYRDRSKIVAWSKIIYHQNHQTSNLREEPVLHLYAINIGLRPIILTDVCSINKKHETQCRYLNTESINTNNISNLTEVISKLEDNLLAHKSNIRLEDGDVYEIKIKHTDYHDYLLANKEYSLADKMFFRDILGKKYKIKNSKKCIKILDDFNKDKNSI